MSERKTKSFDFSPNERLNQNALRGLLKSNSLNFNTVWQYQFDYVVSKTPPTNLGCSIVVNLNYVDGTKRKVVTLDPVDFQHLFIYLRGDIQLSIKKFLIEIIPTINIVIGCQIEINMNLYQPVLLNPVYNVSEKKLYWHFSPADKQINESMDVGSDLVLLYLEEIKGSQSYNWVESLIALM